MTETTRPALIPCPRKLEWLEGTLQLAGGLEGALQSVRLVQDDALGTEGYRIRAGDDLLIEAGSGAGAFYAAQTLRQLLQPDGSVPRCIIEDRPAFSYRGYMLDQGRNFMTLGFLKRQIDIASRYKLNVFHFHPTEYPGWRVETRAFPQLKSEQYYTQDEMRELVRFAEERFVTVIPEIEMPGHCTEFLNLMPHLKCTNDTMCMGNEELYHTLEAILTEVAEIFPSPYIHIGTDECHGGEDCPKCQAKIAEIAATPGGPKTLMAYFITRINEVVKKLGRTTMVWNDQLDNGLPNDLAVFAWRGDSDPAGIASQGFKVVNCHASAVYFDHGQTPDYLPKIYAWTPAEAEGDPMILGGEGEAWHDPPAEEETIISDLGFYPRLITLAERVWTGPEGRNTPFEQFSERLVEHKARFFSRLPFPYPHETWHARYTGWTVPRGVYSKPDRPETLRD